MIIELLLPAIVAGLLIALASGLLGCFVLWRNMAFFSDTLAHSAVLGTGLALLAGFDPMAGLVGYGAAVALVMARFDSTLSIGSDTLLAIIAHASLACGILLLPLTGSTIALESLLFGDILSIGLREVALAALVCLTIAALVAWRFTELVDLAIDEELAACEGVKVAPLKRMLFLALAALVAVAVQLVGVLLISALLLIPAATARSIARTPLQMALFAPLIGMAVVALGLLAAYHANLAAGPAMVVTATLLWISTLLLKRESPL
jgi:zinc transport system permease protein